MKVKLTVTFVIITTYLHFNRELARGYKSSPPASSRQRTAIIVQHGDGDSCSVTRTWHFRIFKHFHKNKKNLNKG